MNVNTPSASEDFFTGKARFFQWWYASKSDDIDEFDDVDDNTGGDDEFSPGAASASVDCSLPEGLPVDWSDLSVPSHSTLYWKSAIPGTLFALHYQNIERFWKLH